MFTRIVAVVVIIAFAFTSTQCATAYRLPREKIPRRSTCVTMVTLDSGDEVAFAAPGGHILTDAPIIVGRTAAGEEQRIRIWDVQRGILATVDGDRREEREVAFNDLLRASREARVDKFIAAAPVSGGMITFPDPGAWVAGPPWTLTGRDGLGGWQEILLDELLYVRVVRADQQDATITALVVVGVVVGAVIVGGMKFQGAFGSSLFN
jgi:hypothetical protein